MVIKMKSNNQQYKLIACDVDGTLVPEGVHDLDPRFYEIVQKAQEQDIILCFASGRQYDDLVALAPEYEDELVYIAANGSVLVEQKEVVKAIELTEPEPKEICLEIKKFSAADYHISTADDIYANPRDPEIRTILTEIYPGSVIFIDNVDQIDKIEDPIIKVALHSSSGVDPYVEHFSNKWGDVCHVAKAGFSWLDFTNSDKGTALKEYCKLKDIPLSETMVFGDNTNDISMFNAASLAGVMSTSDPQVQAHADLIVEDPYQYILDYLNN